MATTHDATALSQFKGTNAPTGFGSSAIVKLHVDMSVVPGQLAATIDGSSSDVIQLWDIPIGCHIKCVLLDVTTAEGATATVAIGDGDSTAGYLAATSINSAAKTATLITDAYGAVGGKLYAAADTLDLLFATAADIDAAVFDVYVYCDFLQVYDA